MSRSLIHIGPYTLQWLTDRYRDPEDGKDKVRQVLWMSKEDGEGMGFSTPENLQKLVDVLDTFWQKEF